MSLAARQGSRATARLRRSRGLAVGACFALLAQALPMAAQGAAAAVIEPGFQVATIASGLNTPTALAIAPDGRIFVTELAGIVKEYDSASDSTPTTVVDLSTQVHAVADRGLLGLAVDPQFPARPYIYVLYMVDAPPGGTAPYYHDACPLSPSGAKDGCPATGRLSRITVGTDNRIVGSELVLIGGTFWCHQQQSHAVDHLAFGPDGALYASSGEGATATFTDWGQHSGAADAIVAPNACGDPPAAAGQPLSLPTTEGGALRAQDLRTSGDTAQGSGAIVRIDPDTGAAMADNPLVGNGVPSDDRHVAYGFRNPFRFTFRPGTNELWVADVGASTWEEIDRIQNPRDPVVKNFGWPCYEGAARMPVWDNLNVNVCEQLYAAGSAAVTAPYWAYRHDAAPDPARCSNGGSAASALAFGGPPYPAQFQGALFVADYVKACVWALMAGTNGLPDPANIKTILTGVAAVDIETGPDGRLYYVDIVAGTLNRLDSFGSNQPPIARFSATPPYGATPLAVQFDASATTDDGAISGLTYAWDLNGDGLYNDATGVTASRTYSASANVTVGLRVTDSSSATSLASFVIQPGNTPPTATIVTPLASTTWASGDTISFSGSASDSQEALGPASMRWNVVLHHCFTLTQCHEHPQGTFDGVSSGSYVAGEHEYPSYLEFRLLVTDSRGLTNTASVRLDPKTVDVNFVSQPAGLALTVGSSVVTSPATVTSIVGSRISVTANSPQTLNGSSYRFSTWSDGGAMSHDIVPPSTGATYTATFVPGGAALLVVGGSPTTLGPGDTAVRSRLEGLGYTVSVVGDTASTAADATGKQVVVISSTSLSSNVNTKFKSSTVPVITWEGGLFDDLGMTAPSGTQLTGQTSLAIVTPGHPLAAGLSGTVVVTSTAGDFTQGSPNANAIIAARLPGTTTASIFAYDAGATMPGGAAPARRVGFFMSDTTAGSLTASGTALLDAAIKWATDTTSPPPPPDTTPPTISSVSPASGATGVAVGSSVTATFSEALDPTTVSGSTFSLVASGTTTPLAATVSYDGPSKTATLNPSAALLNSTAYTATVKGNPGGVKDVAGNLMATDFSWSFTTAAGPPPDTTPPTVSSVSPASAATGVAVGSSVTATFSEALDPTTVSGSTFSLVASGTTTPLAATVSYDGPSKTATLNPSAALLNSTAYTATVKGNPGGVKDVAGNLMTTDFSWSFTTAATGTTAYLSDLAYTVTANGWGPVEKDRSNGEAAAGDGKPLTLAGVVYTKGLGAHAASDIRYGLSSCSTFTVKVGIDDEVGANGSAIFQIWGDATKLADSGVMTGNSPTQTLTVDLTGRAQLRLVIDPNGSANFDHGDWADAKLTCGSPPPPDTTPPTISSVSPASAATGVAVGSSVTATFSEALDPTTVSGSTFSLVASGTTTPLAATVSYDGPSKTATLNPSAALANSTAYTATVKGNPGGVKDVAGNLMTTDFSWSFTTAAGPPPPPGTGALLVVGGNPATLGTGDAAVRSRLQTLGYTVTVVGDSASTVANATGKRIVVISSTVTSTNVNTKFTASAVPVVTWENALFDDLGMTTAAGAQIGGQSSLVIVTPSHPLAAGLTGTIAVISPAGTLDQGSPNANATIVARLPGTTTASIFAYEAAATMPGGAAPARRVALFMGDTAAASFTANGTALFDAAIGWAAGP